MAEMSSQVKELVIARLSVMPSNRKVAIGNFGEFTREELIDHVKQEDEIGKKIAEVEISFLKAVAAGSIHG